MVTRRKRTTKRRKANRSASAAKILRAIRLRTKRFNWQVLWPSLTLVSLVAGVVSGYLIWGLESPTATENEHAAHLAMARQVNPPEGFTLQAHYGDAGPQLLEAGAIDLDRFVELYKQSGSPLTEAQLGILEQGSDDLIVFNAENAYFLLNFFWAFGLTNQNPILTEGPMAQGGLDQAGRFASTGGWTLGTMPAMQLYASKPMVTLSPAQQKLLEAVALNVYRPCCNNPTYFPDCNHGMAMLGMLELMASQGATIDEMFAAAKYANAFWYPAQSLELAQYFNVTVGTEFADLEGRLLLSRNFSSASGFQAVHEWLASGGLLPQAPDNGSGCGV